MFLLLLSIISYSAASQSWERIFGHPGHGEIFSHIEESYDNGYLLINGKDFSPETKGWIIKTDINGNPLYDITLGIGSGSSQANYPVYIEGTIDGGMVLCGSYDEWSFNDVHIAKLDACGELEWCKVFKTDNFPDFGIVVHQLDDGGFTMLTVQYAGLSENQRVHLFRFDFNGQLLWIQPYALEEDYPLLLIVEPWDLVVTDKKDNFITGTCYWYDSAMLGWLKSFSIMADSAQEEMWVTAYEYLNDVHTASTFSTQKSSGDFYIGSVDMSTYSSLLIVQDSLGNYLRDTIPELPVIENRWAEGYLFDLRFASNDKLYAYTYYLDSTGYENGWVGLHELDSLGGWYNTFLHNSFPPARMDITDDQKIIFGSNVGWALGQDISVIKLNMSLQYDSLYTDAREYDYLCPDSIVSKSIDLSPCEVIVDVKDVPNREEYYRSINRIFITPAPNPADDYITFKLKNTEHHRNIRLVIYNIFGNELKTLPVNSGKDETGCEISWLTPGIYMAVSYAGNRIVGSARFVVQ